MTLRPALLALVLGLAACGDETPSDAPLAHDPWLPAADAAGPAVGNPSIDYRSLTADEPAGDEPEITRLADDFADEAAVNMSASPTDREVALRFAWYTHSHLLAATPVTQLLWMLRNRTALCGGSSLIFQIMMRRRGIPTRSVGIGGIPYQSSHATSEVFWNGAWHYVDSTFGAYATADGTLDGELLSWSEIAAYRDFVAPNFNYAVSDGPLGFGYTSPPPGPLVTDLFSLEQVSMKSGGSYADFLPAMNASAVLDGKSFLDTSFGADLSAGQYALGVSDGAYADIVSRYDAWGMYFVGDASDESGPLVNRHLYTITGLTPGDEVIWEAGVVYGRLGALQLKARKAKILEKQIDVSVIRVKLKAKRESLELRVTTSEDNLVRFDYHRFYKAAP